MVVENFPPPNNDDDLFNMDNFFTEDKEKGKTRDIVAKMIGFGSGKQYEK